MKKLIKMLKALYIMFKRRSLDIEIIRADIHPYHNSWTLKPSIKICVFDNGEPVKIFDHAQVGKIDTPIECSASSIGIPIRFNNNYSSLINSNYSNSITFYSKDNNKVELEDKLDKTLKKIKVALKTYKQHKINEELANLNWNGEALRKKKITI